MPDTIPTADLLLQERPDHPDSMLLVVRTSFGRNTYLGAMDSETLIKTARLFLAAAVGEEAVKFMLDCIEVGAESSDHTAADVALHTLAVMRPVEDAVTT
jgi:hypothetical protein